MFVCFCFFYRKYKITLKIIIPLKQKKITRWRDIVNYNSIKKSEILRCIFSYIQICCNRKLIVYIRKIIVTFTRLEGTIAGWISLVVCSLCCLYYVCAMSVIIFYLFLCCPVRIVNCSKKHSLAEKVLFTFLSSTITSLFPTGMS